MYNIQYKRISKCLALCGFLFLFNYCKSDLERLEGHWHITPIDQSSERRFVIDDLSTIDFDTTGIATWGKAQLGLGGILTFIDPVESRIRGGECLSLNISYSFIDTDQLLLIDQTDQDTFIAQKVDWAKCNQQEAFFAPKKINLPVYTKKKILN